MQLLRSSFEGAGDAWLRVRWQTSESAWTAESQDKIVYTDSRSGELQELFGVVEVPETAGRLVVLLGVGGQKTPEDLCWFDDVELYRLPLIRAIRLIGSCDHVLLCRCPACEKASGY